MRSLSQNWRAGWFAPVVQQMPEKFAATDPNVRVLFACDPESFSEEMLVSLPAGPVHLVVPAFRAGNWARCIRNEFSRKAKDVGPAALADGPIRGYSTIFELFAEMDHTKRLAHDAWDRFFTRRTASPGEMADVYRRTAATWERKG